VNLSVVIPALNEANQIAGAAESARAPNVEVLVVDGGSEDGTPERASAAGARVVTSPPGRARQLGLGAREAHGDVLLFLHADTRLPPGYEVAIRNALADPQVVGGAFRFHFATGGSESGERGTTRRNPARARRRGGESGAARAAASSQLALRLVEWGARMRVALFRLPYGDQGLFVRRSVLEAMGGVPQVAIMEDLDLVSGMKRQGRLAMLSLQATTSSRRYIASGPLRTMFRNWLAAAAWSVGADRDRVAAWYRR
jgi:glycosyltransferase involved in cell wall biosynthesis